MAVLDIAVPRCVRSFGMRSCFVVPAVWCLSVWQSIGSPAAFNLVEMGPGKGTLMRDILKATKVVLLKIVDNIRVIDKLWRLFVYAFAKWFTPTLF